MCLKLNLKMLTPTKVLLLCSLGNFWIMLLKQLYYLIANRDLYFFCLLICVTVKICRYRNNKIIFRSVFSYHSNDTTQRLWLITCSNIHCLSLFNFVH